MEFPLISPQTVLIFTLMITGNGEHKEKARDVIGPSVLK